MTNFGGEAPVAWLAQRWGHAAPVLLSVSIVAVIAMRFYPPAGLLGLTAPVAVLAFVIMSWLLMRQHDHGLCERCAAAIPLNPSEQAARCQRMFWLCHHSSEPRYLVPYLVVLIGSNFATSGPGQLCWALIQASMIYLIMAYTTHRRLQPWCPWCRGDGGGERDQDIAPEPPPPVDRRQPV